MTERFPLAEADNAYQALARGDIVGRAIVVTVNCDYTPDTENTEE